MNCSLDEIYLNLITAIRSCPGFPQNVAVHIGETDSRQSAMSIVVDLNLSKSKKTVCGEWINIYDFDFYYQISTQTDNQNVNTFKFLNKLSDYLHSNYYKFNLDNSSFARLNNKISSLVKLPLLILDKSTPA